jgi:hypothetical protein
MERNASSKVLMPNSESCGLSIISMNEHLSNNKIIFLKVLKNKTQEYY